MVVLRRSVTAAARFGGASGCVRLPAGSFSVAVTLFCPGSKTTAGNVATPPAKPGFVYVSVVAPFTTCNTTLAFSALNVTGSVIAADELPHRFAGVINVSTGGTG